MTLSLTDVLRLIDESGIRPSRALGQNFVADANTVRRVARLAAVGPGDRVVEVGAGLGSLTLALAETGASVTAVEKDRWLVPVLRRVLEEQALPVPVSVVEGDAMTLDWDALLVPREGWALVANLPYNVATPLVADLLDKVPAIERMTFMVQREVAERLVAGPGDPAYGAVSVKVAYWAEATFLGTVPSSVFVPQPRVGSALVGLKRRPFPAVDRSLVSADALFRVVRTGFAQRRKMLRRALDGLVVGPEVFDEAGIDGELRAEQLSVADWGRLAAAIAGGPGSKRMSTRPTREVEALAKLTLSLRVTGVRADGYHLLDAEMVTVDLADTLFFQPGDGLEVVTGADEVAGGHGDVPADGTNLVQRALVLAGRSAHVRLVKRIPAGAGLGGGSADAAAVLRWAGAGGPRGLELARELGSDVPFCLAGEGRARVTGTGEVLAPLPFEPCAGKTYTLLVPPFGVQTAAVYRAWDEMGGPISDLFNDLEPAALRVEPRLAAWRDRLGDATGQRPQLAGSGSTWFVAGEYPGDGRVVVKVARSGPPTTKLR